MYLNYLKEQLMNESAEGMDNKRIAYYQTFIRNLSEGIAYYKDLNEKIMDHDVRFEKALTQSAQELKNIQYEFFPAETLVLELA
ncbi:hypothetical protein EMGBS15_06340 [Filimonas sp.]|nr:hypothetical protein EMGBS15_06340 [Filimonas sp.]